MSKKLYLYIFNSYPPVYNFTWGSPTHMNSMSNAIQNALVRSPSSEVPRNTPPPGIWHRHSLAIILFSILISLRKFTQLLFQPCMTRFKTRAPIHQNSVQTRSRLVISAAIFLAGDSHRFLLLWWCELLTKQYLFITKVVILFLNGFFT